MTLAQTAEDQLSTLLPGREALLEAVTSSCNPPSSEAEPAVEAAALKTDSEDQTYPMSAADRHSSTGEIRLELRNPCSSLSEARGWMAAGSAVAHLAGPLVADPRAEPGLLLEVQLLEGCQRNTASVRHHRADEDPVDQHLAVERCLEDRQASETTAADPSQAPRDENLVNHGRQLEQAGRVADWCLVANQELRPTTNDNIKPSKRVSI